MKNLSPITDAKDVATKEYVDQQVLSILPSPTSSDNGKFVKVVNGSYTLASLPTYQGGVS